MSGRRVSTSRGSGAGELAGQGGQAVACVGHRLLEPRDVGAQPLHGGLDRGAGRLHAPLRAPEQVGLPGEAQYAEQAVRVAVLAAVQFALVLVVGLLAGGKQGLSPAASKSTALRALRRRATAAEMRRFCSSARSTMSLSSGSSNPSHQRATAGLVSRSAARAASTSWATKCSGTSGIGLEVRGQLIQARAGKDLIARKQKGGNAKACTFWQRRSKRRAKVLRVVDIKRSNKCLICGTDRAFLVILRAIAGCSLVTSDPPGKRVMVVQGWQTLALTPISWVQRAAWAVLSSAQRG